MFYFYSHRGPQWNRMWKAGHGLLCGHRGLKPLWNAGHMLCAVAIEVSNHCGMLATCFVLWSSRSQDGTGPAILAMIYFVGIDVPRWN